MKFIFSKIIFAVALTGIIGCSSDKCKDVTCQNGGKCLDGTCQCVNNYTGDRCQNAPPAVSAKTVKITGIYFSDYPRTKPDGGGWDNSITGTPAPDIFIMMYSGSTLLSNTEDNRYDNYISSLSKGWSYASPIEISNLNNKIVVQMWDHDDLQDNEQMGSASFTPADYKFTKPSRVTFNSGSVAYSIDLIWTE